jgi:hypothetical protein
MMRLDKRFPGMALAIFAVATASGCGQPIPNSSTAAVSRPPEEVCDKARKSLDDAKSKLLFEYKDNGTGTIAQEAWLRIDEKSRKGLTDSLGFHAACASSQPLAEQEIVIMGETGQVVTRRVVQVTADSAILR